MGTRRGQRIAYVGIDVSKDKLNVAWRVRDGERLEFEIPNDADGHAEIIRRVTAGRIAEARVAFEATGPYSTVLLLNLSKAQKVRAARLRPAQARAYAKAIGPRGKTDVLDARILCDMAARPDFTPTDVPELERLQLQAMARELEALINTRASMNMRRQSATAAGGLSDAFNDLLGGVHAAIDEAIAKMELELERRIKADPKTAEFYDRADSLQGFARRSLVQIIPELAAAPQTLTPRQMVAFAGFDPRPKKSGSSRAGESWSISKMGSRRLRRMLYVCARVAVRWHPPSRAYYEAMLARNKPRMVALVAVARKLLVALWVMWTRGVDFDPSAFTGRWSPDSA